MTTYLLCLVDVLFNRQSAYLCVKNVLLISSTCSFIRTRQTSYGGFARKTKRSYPRSFNFTFRFINNSRFSDCVDRIYPMEIEIKDTTDTDRSASYLDPHLDIDREGRLRTKLYDKRDDFNFPTPYNFPVICSNISACIWSIHLSVDPIFQSLWFLSGFP